MRARWPRWAWFALVAAGATGAASLGGGHGPQALAARVERFALANEPLVQAAVIGVVGPAQAGMVFSGVVPTGSGSARVLSTPPAVKLLCVCNPWPVAL